MGIGNFTDQNEGETAEAVDLQQTIDALKGDQVPRASNGVATANSGEIGNATFPFKRASITTGYFFVGMVIPMHTYNDTAVPGQGWFPCDGTIINETNYNAIHGAGSWDSYIGASSLDGKYSPNMDAKYIIGSDSTSQTGASAITSIGASGNTVDLTHTHTTPSHNHQWYDWFGGSVDAHSFNSSGADVDIEQSTNNAGTHNKIAITDTAVSQDDGLKPASGNAYYTSNNNGGATGSSLSSSQNIRPESIELKYHIRII